MSDAEIPETRGSKLLLDGNSFQYCVDSDWCDMCLVQDIERDKKQTHDDDDKTCHEYMKLFFHESNFHIAPRQPTPAFVEPT